MFVILVLTVVLLCLVHLLFNYNARARALKKVPGPPLKFIIGNTIDFMLPPVELFRYMKTLPEIYKNISRLWCYPYGGVNLYNPEDIEIILSNTKYNDKSIVYKFVKPWLQEGLLLSRGAKWQLRRKIMTPAFHFNILRRFNEVLEENSQKLAHKLDTEKGEVTVDVKPILSEYTLQSICGNYQIPGGTLCHIHIFNLHRREDLFKDALKFNPDRFLPENSVGRHPYAFIPFSAGSRNCIGNLKGLTEGYLRSFNELYEMKSCVSTLLRKFEMHPVSKTQEITFTTDLVLRNLEPVQISFVKRISNTKLII